MMYGMRPTFTGQEVDKSKCWRANCKERVDRYDTLGLCPLHIEEMRDPDFSRDLAPHEQGFNPDARRRV